MTDSSRTPPAPAPRLEPAPTSNLRVARAALPGGVVGYRFRPRWGGMTGWCWRVGGTLVDAGAPALADALAEVVRGDGPLERIVVTHHHEDHAGGAAALRAVTGAPVWAPSWSAPLVRAGFAQKPYHRIAWGRFRPWKPDGVLDLPALGEAPVPGTDLVMLHAPGHAHDMTVVWDAARRALFAADLYLAARLRVMRGDEAWGALRVSLERVLARTDADGGVELLLGGHRPAAHGGRERLERKLAWMRGLERAVAAADAEGRPAASLAGSGAPLFALASLGDMSRANLLRSLRGEVRPRPDVAARVGARVARCEFRPGERAAEVVAAAR